jgi:outer membrane protein OmpA-like peptidoglycan-associated protein
MKKLILLSIVWLINLQNTTAQDINTAIANVRQYVKDIKLEKETVGQKLEANPNSPTEMTLTLSKTNAKGQSSQESYQFNFAFFDISQIKRDADKNQLAMKIKTAENLKAVGIIKNGKPDKYTNELEILCDNADDARDLEKALKEIIPAAKKYLENSLKLPNDFNSLMTMLLNNVKNYNEMGLEVNQNAAQNNTFKDRIKVEGTRAESKKNSTFTTDFSVGDLTESSVKINVSGNEVAIVASTADKAEFVAVSKDKKMEYDTEMRILAASPTKAKTMALILQKLIPLARKELQNRLPKAANGSFDGLKQITSFTTNGIQYEQEITNECVCNYKNNQIEKGKQRNQNYNFNFSDITEFKIDIDRDVAKIKAKTFENLEFVSITEKDKRNFEKNIEFTFEDIEKARYFLAYLPSLSTKCKETLRAENFDWLVNKLKNAGVNGVTQTLSLQEGGNRAKWRFAVAESSSKKSIENVFEFNVYDLDMAKLDFTTRDQNLILKIPTKKKEKLIKQTQDGKPTFTAETQFLLTNAEDAKRINVTIKEIVLKYGLLTDGKFVTNAIEFDANSANIKASSNETLKTVGEMLEDFKDMKIKIIGHTDSDGDDNKNLQLSQKRAQSVKDYLLKNYKIDATRLSYEGKGEKTPAMPNTTPEGKAANRRVEFVKI